MSSLDDLTERVIVLESRPGFIDSEPEINPEPTEPVVEPERAESEVEPEFLYASLGKEEDHNNDFEQYPFWVESLASRIADLPDGYITNPVSTTVNINGISYSGTCQTWAPTGECMGTGSFTGDDTVIEAVMFKGAVVKGIWTSPSYPDYYGVFNCAFDCSLWSIWTEYKTGGVI